ncbi:hypothetical protein K9L97_00475 [Candidatus Woesearchaeota archaeon]|nr:hypothetical protein [Candidatus Woesearchaeota archaeon]
MEKVNITSSEKSSTIRLKQKTKDMLEELAKGKETHEQIILRLIKLANALNSEKNTTIIQKGNIIGTKYETAHKTVHIKIKNQEYVVVCKYNDISIIALLQNKSLKELSRSQDLDWRLDLEIVNINSGKGWENPENVISKEKDLIYFVCLKQLLEEIFDIKLYQFETIEDYFNRDNWSEAYEKNNLSKDSLHYDIRRHLL